MRVAIAAALGLAAGCVVQDPSSTPMCLKTTDCDVGEVCGEDRICYGNPPSLPLSLILEPPSTRTDLAPVEVVSFSATAQGDFGAVFTAPLTLSGRVVLADAPERSISAQLVLRRASRIPGGPDLVVSTTSTGGLEGDSPSFQVRVPPVLEGESYTVTIFPDATAPAESPESPSPAELAPPYRRTGFAFATDVSGLVFPLGGADGQPGKKLIRGRVRDASGNGVAGYDARAYGRFSAADPVELASSRATTDAKGTFEISVPATWVDDFEVRLTPLGDLALPIVVLPVVHVDDPVDATPVVTELGEISLPPLSAPQPYAVHAAGTAPGGGTHALGDATVTMTTVLVDTPDRRVIYRASGVVDAEGDAQLLLVPGTANQARAYLVDVAPAPGSPNAQRWAVPVDIGPPTRTIELPVAPLRVLVAGSLLDENLTPAAGVTLRATPTDEVALELIAEPTLRQTEVRWPETQTDREGHFALWLDLDVAEIPMGYVLSFEPPVGSLLPRFTLTDFFPLPDATGGDPLGQVTLPEAAYARGVPTDPRGAPVPGATLRVYERVVPVKPCTVSCQPRAILRSQATVDESGTVRLVLPRL